MIGNILAHAHSNFTAGNYSAYIISAYQLLGVIPMTLVLIGIHIRMISYSDDFRMLILPGCSDWVSGAARPGQCSRKCRPRPGELRARHSPSGCRRTPSDRCSGPSTSRARWTTPSHLSRGTQPRYTHTQTQTETHIRKYTHKYKHGYINTVMHA